MNDDLFKEQPAKPIVPYVPPPPTQPPPSENRWRGAGLAVIGNLVWMVIVIAAVNKWTHHEDKPAPQTAPQAPPETDADRIAWALQRAGIEIISSVAELDALPTGSKFVWNSSVEVPGQIDVDVETRKDPLSELTFPKSIQANGYYEKLGAQHYRIIGIFHPQSGMIDYK